mmetsp:Transcript_5189/g.9114  ORF Transcript_5189/g.9114 Transcript_5189/m.9114 type:complete len:133 (-) Transcript_5189:199-597(-)
MPSSPPLSPKARVNGKEQDVTEFVSDMLSQMESEFEQTGNSIMDRMKLMGDKMNALERSIGDLMVDAGLENVNNIQQHGKDSIIKPTTTSTAAAAASNISPAASMEEEDGEVMSQETHKAAPHGNHIHKAIL